ncbi:solute carrier family 35 member C2 [Ischnura elegans]|uniref:solute carrier family 35 member C2 n=1 Tax=Ischnura elegans TaxID=197161 RepID=UPI001ED8B68C|nr:solute carrier family 35 member C2 [Ischnura elegans]
MKLIRAIEDYVNKCHRGLLTVCIRTLSVICIYYILSIGLVFYQNRFLKFFHYPLSVVVCHMVVKFILAGICRKVWECYHRKDRVTVEWKNYIMKVGPTGLTSGLDIGFSNWGLELVTVSLYTMTKSTAIIFIMGFALIFKLEEKSWKLVFIVLNISLGLMLFTYKAAEFNVLGFCLVLFASFISGLRWTLAQLVMQKSKLGLQNPVDMVYHVQPWMIVALLPIALAVEGKTFIANHNTFNVSDWDLFLRTVGLVLIGCVMAFLMELAEYMVVSYTSGLTLSVAGIFKELVTVMLAVSINGDQLSVINYIGFLLCLGGIVNHVALKAMATQAVPIDSLEEEVCVSPLPVRNRTGWKGNSEDSHIPLMDLTDGSGVVAYSDLSDSDTGESAESANEVFNVLKREWS